MSQTYVTSWAYPGIPTPMAIKPAILQHVADDRRYRFGDIYVAMVAHLDLTPELERVTFPHAGGVNHSAPSGSNVFCKYRNNACRDLVNLELLTGEGGRYEDKA